MILHTLHHMMFHYDTNGYPIQLLTVNNIMTHAKVASIWKTHTTFHIEEKPESPYQYQIKLNGYFKTQWFENIQNH